MPCGHWTKKVWTKIKTGPKSSEGYEVKLKQPLLSKPSLMTIAVGQLPFSNYLKKDAINHQEPSVLLSDWAICPLLMQTPTLPYPHPRPHFPFHSDLEVTFPCHSLTPVLSKCQPLCYGSFLHLLFFSEGRTQSPIHTCPKVTQGDSHCFSPSCRWGLLLNLP